MYNFLVALLSSMYTVSLYDMYCTCRAHYFGDNTPSVHPDYYIRCVHSLFKFYKSKLKPEHSPLPLVVNTCGWLRGENGDEKLWFTCKNQGSISSNNCLYIMFESSQQSIILLSIISTIHHLNNPSFQYPSSQQSIISLSIIPTIHHFTVHHS